jgi:carboxylesterase
LGRVAAQPSDAAARPTEPFFFPGGDVGCLLVHGFTGTPYEMRYLGERLHAAGHTVNAVCLAGHGTQWEDLASCRWQDWYRSVEDGLSALESCCRRTVAVGLSLGSLLALRLASERPQAVSALVLLSCALVIANPWPARAQWILRSALPILPPRWRSVTKPGSDIADHSARSIHPSYGAMPLESVLELVALQRQVRPLLPRIVQPAMAIHSHQDHTAPVENVAVLQRELPNLRAAVVLPESYHVLTVDLEKERVADEITAFIEAVVGGSRPAEPAAD